MLPTYVITFAALGLSYMFGPNHIAAASPALAFADHMMPLEAWGSLFLGCSTLMAIALATHRRTLYRWALRMCGVSMTIWALVIGLATLNGDATPAAAAWPAFIAIACVATDRSLAAREV
jgi:hypothetical protein